MIRWIFIDIDDTICNSSAAYARALRACFVVFRRSFPKLPEKLFYQAYNLARLRTHRRLKGTANMHDRALYFEELLRILKLPFSAPILERLTSTYWAETMRNLKLVNRALPTLRSLRKQGIHIGVVSDLLEEVQVQKLKRLGVSRYVDFLVTSEAVGREKPNSAMFRAALKRAGCKAHEAIMVGDSARRDVAGAKHMGLKAVLVGRGPKGIADARIFTFRQLTPRLINRLQLPTSKKL